jgi:hypothetical protein
MVRPDIWPPGNECDSWSGILCAHSIYGYHQHRNSLGVKWSKLTFSLDRQKARLGLRKIENIFTIRNFCGLTVFESCLSCRSFLWMGIDTAYGVKMTMKFNTYFLLEPWLKLIVWFICASSVSPWLQIIATASSGEQGQRSCTVQNRAEGW